MGAAPLLFSASGAQAAPLPARRVTSDGAASTASAPDDAALVARVQAGDSAAYSELVQRYMRRAFSLAFRLLQQREDAEDTVQEAFVAALDRIDTFDITRPFAPWFLRIVATRSFNLQRSRSRRDTQPLLEDTASHSDPAPDVVLERAEVRERFARAVQALPERHREIIQLFEVDGISTADIAAAFELSQGTVRWYIHEARRALRIALAPLRDGRSESPDRGTHGEHR